MAVKATIVGGYPKLLRGSFGDNLRAHGVEIVQHLCDTDTPPPIAKAAEVVIILTDSLKHKLAWRVQDDAKSKEKQVVLTTRRWVKAHQDLEQAGVIRPSGDEAMRGRAAVRSRGRDVSVVHKPSSREQVSKAQQDWLREQFVHYFNGRRAYPTQKAIFAESKAKFGVQMPWPQVVSVRTSLLGGHDISDPVNITNIYDEARQEGLAPAEVDEYLTKAEAPIINVGDLRVTSRNTALKALRSALDERTTPKTTTPAEKEALDVASAAEKVKAKPAAELPNGIKSTTPAQTKSGDIEALEALLASLEGRLNDTLVRVKVVETVAQKDITEVNKSISQEVESLRNQVEEALKAFREGLEAAREVEEEFRARLNELPAKPTPVTFDLGPLQFNGPPEDFLTFLKTLAGIGYKLSLTKG